MVYGFTPRSIKIRNQDWSNQDNSQRENYVIKSDRVIGSLRKIVLWNMF